MCNTVRHSRGEVKRVFLRLPRKGGCAHISAHGWRTRTGGPYGLAYLTDRDGGTPVVTIKAYEVTHTPPHEGDRMTTHIAQADDGKHGGEPSDKPWVPDPAPAPSPDGSRPQKHGPQS